VIGDCIKIALLVFGDVPMKLKLQIVMIHENSNRPV
jgi:hypothetical protein